MSNPDKQPGINIKNIFLASVALRKIAKIIVRDTPVIKITKSIGVKYPSINIDFLELAGII